MTASRTRRWRTTAVAAAAAAVWGVNLTAGDGAPDVVATPAATFSLDLSVVGTSDAPLLYAVEQRAAPSYRIFSLEPSTGVIETVFTVPEGAAVYGIALDPTGTRLAVAYTPDVYVPGNGVVVLELATGATTQAVAEVTDVHLVDLLWAEDGTQLYATSVDVSGDTDELAVLALSLEDGSTTVLVEDAVDPAQAGDVLLHLPADVDTSARTSVAALDLSTGLTQVVVSGAADLDHLAVAADGTITVAVLDGDEAATGLTFGAPAEAHGTHDIPSTWWDVSTATAWATDPILTYDAVMLGDVTAEVTLTGLSVVQGGTRVELLRSRALRFITG